MTNKSRETERGVALITVLLLLVILLILGLAFLTQQVHLYRSGSEAGLALMARSMAEAGLEDARAKLEKDFDFPPLTDGEQLVFSYSETLSDISGSHEIGSYSVTVDLSKREENEVILVTSEGRVGQESPVRRELYAELDTSLDIGSNSRFFRFIHIEDSGLR